MGSAIKLYNDVSTKCSELITKNYSTSFSLGIYTLDKSLNVLEKEYLINEEKLKAKQEMMVTQGKAK